MLKLTIVSFNLQNWTLTKMLLIYSGENFHLWRKRFVTKTAIQTQISLCILDFKSVKQEPPKKQRMTITLCYSRSSEKAMAPHSSTLAWKIPWAEEPGRLQPIRSLRVGHNWATSLSLFTFMHWRRKWQPTPVFLPGESQGQGSLVGCRLWDRTRVRHDWSDLAAA